MTRMQDINILLLSYNKYFPEESLYYIRQHLEATDEEKRQLFFSIEFKDPMMALILSLICGSLGGDRFYIGDITLGVLKLLTCGGFGVWTIVDYFLIMKATKKKNFEKLSAYIIN